jgi:predicted RNA-binding Zn-ribbon protein involved in translation (DUF1610 family)
MAKKTTTTYECDGCGQEAEKASALRRFIVAEKTLDNRVAVEAAQTELCVSCEKGLHAALKPLMPEAEYAKLEGYVR